MQTLQVAIVGGETLLGKELRDVLTDQIPLADIHMLGGEEGTGILTEHAGEAVVLGAVDANTLADMDVVLLAGSPNSSQTAYRLVQEQADNITLIDLTYTLEDRPESRLRAPQAETDPQDQPETVAVIAHPAALALGLLLRRLHAAHPIRQSVVNIFEPASERGQRGLDEMQQQTTNLLAFKSLPTDIYGMQVSFTLLPRLGEEAVQPLEDIESRVERHLASLLGGSVPMPSLRLSHAPVFHGYSMSVWVELEDAPDPEAIATSLASEHIEVRTGSDPHPSNFDIAGQSSVVAGTFERDRNHPRALWFWVAVDNLRVPADGAALLVKELLP